MRFKPRTFKAKVIRALNSYAERKYTNYAVQNIPVNTGLNIIPWHTAGFGDFPQGSGRSNRIGNKVRILTYSMKLSVRMPAAAMALPAAVFNCRLLILWPKTSQQELLAITSPSTYFSIVDQDDAFVWKDWQFGLSTATNPIKEIVFYKKFPNKSLFESGTDTVPNKYPLLFYIGDQAPGSVASPLITGYFKSSYTDI